jgi:predicted nucleic acid-binding Zn ribbon protein
MSDPALVDCPCCGAAGLKKRISAAGFRLAGSGWYETDFKTGKKKNLVENSQRGQGGQSESAVKSSGDVGSKASSSTTATA